jgi:hypothetical protein
LFENDCGLDGLRRAAFASRLTQVSLETGHLGETARVPAVQ